MAGPAAQRAARRAGAGERAPGRGAGAAAQRRRHRAVNRRITQAAERGGLPGLLEEVRGQLPGMNGINLATALHRLAKLAAAAAADGEFERARQLPLLQELLQAILERVLGHGLCGRAEGPPGEESSDLPAQEDEEMPVQCLSIVCWSCATLQIRHRPLLMAIADITSKRLSDLQPYELSNLLWAYAKLSLCPSDLLTSVAARLLHRRDREFKVQCLATVAWSLATLKRRSPPVFASLASELAARAGELKPQELSNALWAFAKGRYVNKQLFQALGNVAAEESRIWLFKPQELSNIVWAFATADLQHATLFAQVEKVSVQKRYEMGPQNIANILWSFAKLHIHTRSPVFPALLEVATLKLQQHKPEELSAVVWAAAQRCPGQARFLAAAAAACAARAREFSANALANLAKAFAVVQMDAPHFFVKLLQHSLTQLAYFNSSALGNLFRGATTAMLNTAFSSELQEIEHAISVICENLVKRVDELNSAELLDVSTTLHMRRCTTSSSSLLDTIVRSRLQKQETPNTKAAPGAAPSAGSLSTAEGEEAEEAEGAEAAEAAEAAAAPAGARAGAGGASTSSLNEQPIFTARRVLSEESLPASSGSSTSGEQELLPQTSSRTPCRVPVPARPAQQRPGPRQAPRTIDPQVLEPATVNCVGGYLKPSPFDDPVVVTPSGCLADFSSTAAAMASFPQSQRGNLSQWLAECCDAGGHAKPLEAAEGRPPRPRRAP